MSVYRNSAYLANESEGERRFRTAWERLVPDLDLEQEYEVGTGNYRLDFAHVPTRTAIEIDGLLGHASAHEIARDRRRQRTLEDLGWRFRRFGGQEVMRAPERCVTDAAAFLRRRQRQQAALLARPPMHHLPDTTAAGSQHPAPGSTMAPIGLRPAPALRPPPGICVLPAPDSAATGPRSPAPAAAEAAHPQRSRRHLLRWAMLGAGAYLGTDLLLWRLLTGQPVLPGLPARVPAGQRLYQANWTQGADGWPVGNRWHIQHALLIGPKDSAALLWAPVSLDTPNYAVEAMIRILWHADHHHLVGAGLLVCGDGKRRGYAGIRASLPMQGATLMIQALHAGASDLTRSVQPLEITDLAPRSPLVDGLWHRYRFEVTETGLALSLDGATLLRVLDTTSSGGGAVGLIASGCQIAVEQFTVTAL